MKVFLSEDEVSKSLLCVKISSIEGVSVNDDKLVIKTGNNTYVLNADSYESVKKFYTVIRDAIKLE